jgi:putative membrane protein
LFPESPTAVPTKTIPQLIANYARGLLMGGADIIPGVSGGTVALIVGIYERLVHCIKLVFDSLVALLRGSVPEFRRQFAEVEWLLIVPLFAGIVTALLIGAAFIPDLLEHYPVQMRALFFGLILGSLTIPWRRMTERGPRALALVVTSAIAAFILVGLPAREAVDPSLWSVFFMAAVAICAMILPGVSGAFLLLVFGIYEPTLSAIHNRELLYVVVFGAGAAVGLGSFSGILNWLLEHYHDLTMAVLLGLMGGSLRALWPWITVDRSLLLPDSTDNILIPIVLMIAGVAFVLALSRFTGPELRDATSA